MLSVLGNVFVASSTKQRKSLPTIPDSENYVLNKKNSNYNIKHFLKLTLSSCLMLGDTFITNSWHLKDGKRLKSISCRIVSMLRVVKGNVRATCLFDRWRRICSYCNPHKSRRHFPEVVRPNRAYRVFSNMRKITCTILAARSVHISVAP